MHRRTVMSTAAMTIALIAGIGLTGSPAHAKATTTVTGSAKVSILESASTAMGNGGTQVNAEPPATFESEYGWSLSLPADRQPRAGVLPLGGGISIGASINRLFLTAPRLEYAAGSTGAPARMTFEVESMGPDAPANLTDGTRIALFDVPQLAVKVTKGGVTSSGKVWTRVDIHRFSGDVLTSSDAALLSSINTYIGLSYFTPSSPFATLNTVIKVKVTCATRAACR